MSDKNNGKNILLIDDEVDLAEITGFQLKAHGYDVVIAHNGIEGLRKLENYTPDLIILDINMPKMGGIEFYERIIEYDDKPKFPILILTARANLEELFSQLTVEGFMIKPFELEDLLKEVDMITKKEDESAQPIGGNNQFKKVMIVEDTLEAFHKISLGFLDDGYTVVAAKSGAEAFEKIKTDQPDLVIVKMTLSDLAGDQVILKLKKMPQSRRVKFILYFPEGIAQDASIAQKIDQKAGVDLEVETDNPNILLKKAKSLF